MGKGQTVLLLTDAPGGAVSKDLDILYPGRVRKLDITSERHGLRVLRQHAFVVTVITSGPNLRKLDYKAVTAYAKAGGQVLSCLYEYAANRGLHFSKTYVGDRIRPQMKIELETDVTSGYSVGDTLGWFGTVTTAPTNVGANQMLQRQVMGVREGRGVRLLGTSTINGGAVMVEERIGQGRIVALDMLSPNRPFFNSWGSTSKYLFLGNVVNRAVRYGKHYPERLPYDGFVEAMHELARRNTSLSIQNEGQCSDGRLMWSFSIGEEANPTIYLGGAIHGWEWENAYGLMRFAEVLCEDPAIEGLDTRRLHFKIMPVQNPWGFDHFTRQNTNGVDLNRNFDCSWKEFQDVQDVKMPWDYSYKGASPASERETQVVQGIIDRYLPFCVIDFHTADYIMLLPHKGDKQLLSAIHRDIKRRLKNRFLTYKPLYGPYQQVNMDRITDFSPASPMCISYAAERGTPASFLIEMSGNRDDVHALVMNTDTVVEICLAAVKQCLRYGRRSSHPQS